MRKLIGIIVSDKMVKTRIVEVARLKKDSKYLKYFNISKRFKAHDEKSEYKTGDRVIIQEVRPMSREKRWIIISKT